LTYPLATTTFTKEQCAAILKPLFAVGLLAIGIVRNFPQVVVHGPYNKHGLQFPNLYTEQMVQQIMTLLLHHKDMSNPIGALINANCEVLRLEMGWIGNIFDIPEECKNVITKSWIKKVMKECHKNNITIQSKI